MAGSGEKETITKIPPSRLTKTINKDWIMRMMLKWDLNTFVTFICEKNTASHKNRLKFNAKWCRKTGSLIFEAGKLKWGVVLKHDK